MIISEVKKIIQGKEISKVGNGGDGQYLISTRRRKWTIMSMSTQSRKIKCILNLMILQTKSLDEYFFVKLT